MPELIGGVLIAAVLVVFVILVFRGARDDGTRGYDGLPGSWNS